MEKSTFVLKFVASIIASELVITMQYKLCMLEITINGPANVFGNSESVEINSAFAGSQLRGSYRCFYVETRENTV